MSNLQLDRHGFEMETKKKVDKLESIFRMHEVGFTVRSRGEYIPPFASNKDQIPAREVDLFFRVVREFLQGPIFYDDYGSDKLVRNDFLKKVTAEDPELYHFYNENRLRYLSMAAFANFHLLIPSILKSYPELKVQMDAILAKIPEDGKQYLIQYPTPEEKADFAEELSLEVLKLYHLFRDAVNG